MRDPRNEREAQPHLQRMADLKYLKHERTKVRPSYTESQWREIAAVILGYAAVAFAVVVGLIQLWRIL